MTSDDARVGRFFSPWLLFALGIFLLQVLPYLSHRWVTDESWYAGPGYSISLGHGVADPAIGPNDLENQFDARPPGTALVIAFFFKLLGPGAIAARLGSVFAGLGVITLTYSLARSTLGQRASIIVAMLVATDNFLVLAARTARPEALTTLAIIASFTVMVRYRKRAPAWSALSGFLMAMGAMFHVTLLGYIISFGLLAIIFSRDKAGSAYQGAVAYSVGFVAGLLPFAAWILSAPRGRDGFRIEYLSRALGEPLRTKFIHELGRYVAFFGFDSLHTHGLQRVPMRLAIPFLLLSATWLLWRYRRRWFYFELVLLAPSLLWLVDTANKSSRYLCILAPMLAILAGAGYVAARSKPQVQRAYLALVLVVLTTQVSANFILLNGARKADYTAVAAKLKSVVPPGEPVYGTITFWLAFHDHPYISSERTDPWMAARDFHVRYFIAGDRMMTMGSAGDAVYYRTLNAHFKEVVEGSTVVGHFPDPYYGDLVVYKLGR